MTRSLRLKTFAIIAAVAFAAGIGTHRIATTHAASPQQSATQHAAPATPAAEKFSPITIEGDHLVRDGKPYQIISGEMHYPRIPHEYWRDRIRMARAMGLNTIQTYAFWNAHEPKPGVFDFTGDLDIAEFLRTAQEEKMNVLLRLGPYVCAEWDAGGFPAWLFADPSLKVRTTDPKFLEAAGKYLDRIGAEVAPFQATRGGPVIGFQIENEYGSYGPNAGKGVGDDRARSYKEATEYMEAIRKLFIHAGLGESLFYTANGTEADTLAMGSLPDVVAVANFGPGEGKETLARLQTSRPHQPVMVGEYWDGWFDAWGDDHAKTNTDQQVSEVAWMLNSGFSVNLYMVHGGTTFGFMNGANLSTYTNEHYAPETSSYDYNAPIDEAGRPTPKYFKFRDMIADHTGVASVPMPQNIPVVAVPEFPLSESAPLWKNLPRPVFVKRPRSMETFGQSYGYIVYHTELNTDAPVAVRPRDDNPLGAENGASQQRYPGAMPSGSSRSGSPVGAGNGSTAPPSTDSSSSQSDDSLPSAASGDKTHIGRNAGSSFGAGDSILVLDEVRDFAAVYIDHKLAGTIDRRLQQSQLALRIPPGKVALDLVVENTGRVNYGPDLADGRAGITSSVTLGGRELLDWKVFPLPMTSPNEITGWGKHALEGPAFYRGTFSTDNPADTFLDVSKFGKGFVWVNGHNLGRIWSIGPQQSLYVPAPWLKRGANEVIVFDFARQKHPTLHGVADPIFNTPAPVSTRWWCEPNCASDQ